MLDLPERRDWVNNLMQQTRLRIIILFSEKQATLKPSLHKKYIY